jgi:ATP-binding cassette subfamily C protein
MASEARVLAALDRMRGHVTILLIAHREATLCHADRVVLLNQGRVIQVTQA